MDQVIRRIQLVAVAFILLATALAFLLEVNSMYINRSVNLADLLLLFIYIEVIGMIRLFWESKFRGNLWYFATSEIAAISSME